MVTITITIKLVIRNQQTVIVGLVGHLFPGGTWRVSYRTHDITNPAIGVIDFIDSYWQSTLIDQQLETLHRHFDLHPPTVCELCHAVLESRQDKKKKDKDKKKKDTSHMGWVPTLKDFVLNPKAHHDASWMIQRCRVVHLENCLWRTSRNLEWLGLSTLYHDQPHIGNNDCSSLILHL